MQDWGKKLSFHELTVLSWKTQLSILAVPQLLRECPHRSLTPHLPPTHPEYYFQMDDSDLGKCTFSEEKNGLWQEINLYS